MNQIKMALLGCGDVAQRDYLPELHRLADQVELVAVCGRSEQRTRAVADQYHIPTWHTDYARMLAETDADAVINLTPIQLHTETTLAALQAGKHVYSEKPIASSVADARRIADERQRHDRVLVCAPCVMLFPQVRYSQQLLADNALGTISAARGYGHGGVPPWGGYMSDPSPFFASGGGPAFDMGVYPLHALTGLLGPAQRVTAMTSRIQQHFTVMDGPATGRSVPLEVDDNWQIILDFGQGRLATIAANNCVQDSRAPQLELFGLQGTIALNLLDVSAPVEVLRAGAGWEQITLPRTGRESGPDHLLGVAHLVECIRGQRQPVLSIEHALHVVDIIETAARSAATGQTLALETTFDTKEAGL
ncbi:MAG: Gfo/Idh/MocA family oxidoreductase [Chloroflexota bacterium]|nr:Gfo/Idh/MocA family oxidoreductase [Chloroflexota bacterium]